MGIAGAGMFGVFLFLTYYLQNTLGFSPIKTGLAFLPMTGGVVATSTLATTRLLPRIGPRPLVMAGMLAGRHRHAAAHRRRRRLVLRGDVLPALVSPASAWARDEPRR